MMRSPFVVVMAMLIVPHPAAAQSIQEALRGYSVVVQYSETVMSRKGSKSRVWKQGIYVSDQGRIFAHTNVAGGPWGDDRHFSVTPGSDNSGGASPFRWTATGFTRQWTNHRGRAITQTISVAKENGAFSCSMSISRSQWKRSPETQQICKVVKGNALKGL